MKNIFRKLFTEKPEGPAIQLESTEYRIREAIYKDRIEFYPEAKYDKNSIWYAFTEWQNIGDCYHIMFDKGYDTIMEAQSRIEIRKIKEKYSTPPILDMRIIEEKIHKNE